MDVNIQERPGDPINFAAYRQADYDCLPVFDIIKEFMENIHSSQLQFITSHDSCAEVPKSPQEKAEADQHFLSLLLSDLHNASILGLEPSHAIDDITRAFLDMNVTENKITPLWLVFAIQIKVRRGN